MALCLIERRRKNQFIPRKWWWNPPRCSMRILIYVHDPCHPENQIASRAVVTLADWVRAERVPSHCRPIPLRTEAASGRCYSFKMKGQTFDYLRVLPSSLTMRLAVRSRQHIQQTFMGPVQQYSPVHLVIARNSVPVLSWFLSSFSLASQLRSHFFTVKRPSFISGPDLGTKY